MPRLDYRYGGLAARWGGNEPAEPGLGRVRLV